MGGMIDSPPIAEYEIDPGYRGTEQTIRAMQRVVSEDKRKWALLELASGLANSCPGHKQYLCWVKQIHGFIQRTVKYVRDPVGIEQVAAPLVTLQRRAGDCDDQATLFNALCEVLGMRTYFKTIIADPSRPSDFSHVYSVVDVPKVSRIPVDCTQHGQPIGWEPRGYPGKLWKGSLE